MRDRCAEGYSVMWNKSLIIPALKNDKMDSSSSYVSFERSASGAFYVSNHNRRAAYTFRIVDQMTKRPVCGFCDSFNYTVSE